MEATGTTPLAIVLRTATLERLQVCARRGHRQGSSSPAPGIKMGRDAQPHLAIVSKELFNKAQKQRNAGSNPHSNLKFGRRAKRLLSGLLKCKLCGANYVMGDNCAYACSSFLGGRACSNSEKVRRDEMERVLLQPVVDGLLDPDRVRRMVREMEAELQRRLAKADAKHAAAPKELADLDARLRTRLKDGDPDLTWDELQAAIEKAVGKREQMAEDLPSGR